MDVENIRAFYKVFRIGSWDRPISITHSRLHDDLKIDYHVPGVIRPKHGRIFVFNGLVHAKGLADAYQEAMVYRVLVEDPVQCHVCAPLHDLMPTACDMFWRRQGVWANPALRQAYDWITCPIMTYAVTSVQLLEKVHDTRKLTYPGMDESGPLTHEWELGLCKPSSTK